MPKLRLRPLLATAICAFLIQVGTASAFTYDGRSGSPGNVVTLYKVQGSHWSTCPPYGCWTTWLTSPGPVLSRSRATSGAQQIIASYYIYRWYGRWSHQTTATSRATLRRGYGRLQLPAISVFPSPAGSEHWSVYIVIRWYTGRGRWLGTRKLDMNHYGDYSCRTSFACEVGNGWVYVS